MSRQLTIIPSIYIRDDYGKTPKGMRGKQVKFALRDDPDDEDPEAKHEKKVTMFSGEYGDDNALYWCEFESSLLDVFKQKPCDTGKKKFTITRACLEGAARKEWEDIYESVEDEEDDDTFEDALVQLKRTYFTGNTPRKDQIEYLQNLKKPNGATVGQFMSEVSQMVANLKYFPPDLNQNDEILDEDDQPVFEDEDWVRLMVRSIPKNWHDKLTTGGIDPLRLERNDLKSRLQRMEKAEQHERKLERKFKERDNKKKANRKGNGNGKKGKKHCTHCNTNTHNTSECYFKNDHAKKNGDRKRKRDDDADSDDRKPRAKDYKKRYNHRVKRSGPDDESSSEDSYASDRKAKRRNKRSKRSPSPDDTNSTSSESRSYEHCFMIGMRRIARLQKRFRRLMPLNPNRNKPGIRKRKEAALSCNILPEDSSMEAECSTALLDTGSTASLIHCDLVPRRYWRKTKRTSFSTKGGTFEAKYMVSLEIMLPELSTSKTVRWTFYVDESEQPIHGVLLGSDFLSHCGIDCHYSTQTIVWGEAIAPMLTQEETEYLNATKHFIQDEHTDQTASKQVRDTAKRATEILDAKYEKADLEAIVENVATLNGKQKKALLKLLKKFETLFDGTLGDFNCEPADIELKPGHDQPYHAKAAFSVPHIHRKTLRKEINRLVQLGVLKKNDDSPHAYPTFIIPKSNGTVRFVTDFRKLNEKLRRKNCPPPTIADILQHLEGFQFATALDLNMGYYTIRLTPGAQNICTILTPWGKYSYKRLPMGVSAASDIFQSKIMTLMSGLEDFVRTYLDDLLIIGRNDFDEHLTQLERVLQRLQSAGLKVNAPKSTFFATEIEYLGFNLSQQGITPCKKKVDAIVNMERPKNQKDVRRFIGMINFYRDMWRHRSTLLAPLTELTKKSSKKKFVWEEHHEQAFQAIKEVLTRDVILAYPDFTKKFTIYTDASDFQLGSVIMQEGRPLAFYSRKLSETQRKYTTTERELLSIVETLREYRNILLGYEIEIFTDHQNLTFDNITSDRVHRWTMYIEEFGPELKYIKGEANVVADALSRLPLRNKSTRPVDSPKGTAIAQNTIGESINRQQLQYIHAIQTRRDRKLTEKARRFWKKDQKKETNPDEPRAPYKSGSKRKRAAIEGSDAQDDDLEKQSHPPTEIPIDYAVISKYQWRDVKLLQKVETLSGVRIKKIQNTSIIVDENDKILVPQPLRKPLIDWYHSNLCHPGVDRTENTIRRNFYWRNIREDIRGSLADCSICKLFKRQTKKYGHLPAKIAEAQPWKKLCVDLVGPYKVRDASHKEYDLLALTMIDPATSWFEIAAIPDKQSETVAMALDRQWFCRYPRPEYITFDQGGEFTGQEFQELIDSYGVKGKPASSRNPQSNSVIERMHLTLHNILRTFDLQNQTMDPFDPWSGFLSAAAYAIRSTYHMSNLATPAELVFGRDMVFDRAFNPDWEKIRRHKQKRIEQNNSKENSKRIKYDYRPGDLVLYKRRDTQKHARPYDGPYELLQKHSNGTATIAIGDRRIKDRVNIRLLTPYTPRTNQKPPLPS